MDMPNLVRHGLYRDYENGYSSSACSMLYNYTKKSPEEISQIIRETWEYIKEENESCHVLSHFLYVINNEVEREWIKDISIDIVKYGLNYNHIEVLESTINLIESWHDEDILDLLYNKEIKSRWLHEYKLRVLEDFGYCKKGTNGVVYNEIYCDPKMGCCTITGNYKCCMVCEQFETCDKKCDSIKKGLTLENVKKCEHYS